MTDEYPGQDSNEPTPPPGMPAGEHDEKAVLEGAGDFTSGEGLVAFAGMVLLAVWVIFDLIADVYPMDNLVPVLGIVALLLPRLNREKVERVHPLPVLMKIIGWVIVLVGVVEILIDLRSGFFDEFGAIIGGLAAYAGYAMAFVGTRQIET